MQDKFGQILVPVEEVVEMKGGQKNISERKFFPGYVLVEMEMTDESWHLVKNTPKVTGFVGGSAHKPTPISEREVQAILNQIQEGVEKPKPKVLFEVGEGVRVKEGPFTDFHGIVEEVNYDKSKLRVSVSIFGRVDAGGTRVQSGREGVRRPAPGNRCGADWRRQCRIRSGEGEVDARSDPIGERSGKEDRRFHQAAGAGGQGESLRRPSARRWASAA